MSSSTTVGRGGGGGAALIWAFPNLPSSSCAPLLMVRTGWAGRALLISGEETRKMAAIFKRRPSFLTHWGGCCCYSIVAPAKGGRKGRKGCCWCIWCQISLIELCSTFLLQTQVQHSDNEKRAPLLTSIDRQRLAGRGTRLQNSIFCGKKSVHLATDRGWLLGYYREEGANKRTVFPLSLSPVRFGDRGGWTQVINLDGGARTRLVLCQNAKASLLPSEQKKQKQL